MTQTIKTRIIISLFLHPAYDLQIRRKFLGLFPAWYHVKYFFFEFGSEKALLEAKQYQKEIEKGLSQNIATERT